jgi:uncharacterized membrane protein
VKAVKQEPPGELEASVAAAVGGPDLAAPSSHQQQQFKMAASFPASARDIRQGEMASSSIIIIIVMIIIIIIPCL